MEAHHEPVLLAEALDELAVAPNDVVVDATIGGAGHFRALLSKLASDGTLIGIDADPEAAERGRQAYAEDRRVTRPTTHIVTDNFRNLSRILSRLSVGHIQKALFDLGWSGYQLAASRGFSFQGDEPLFMTYGSDDESAASLVNRLSERELADLLYGYGEERYARSIARSIVAARATGRILTTGALVEAVRRGVPRAYQNGKRHFATKTFQALRIAANDELNALVEGVSAALGVLAPEGRLAVITFHSIEDRIVKKLFAAAVAHGVGTLVSKKAITPSYAEIQKNHRARSAKLRVFERNAAPLSVPEASHFISSYA